jgi:hypothetical protein
MTHGEAAHERGTHNMFTGYRPSPALQFPSIGSVMSHEFGARKNLPPYVCIPSMPNVYAGSGYLSSAFAPFSLGSDPADGGYKVRDLDLYGGIDDSRFATRRNALEAVNAYFQKKEKSDKIKAMDSFYDSAFSLISSPEAKAAFDISKEPDLEQRGLLDSTLVMVSSEFGRTPKINGTAGRDHWPKVFSVVLAGGGVKKGYVHGTSNATASEPDEAPLGVEDLFTTVYHCLGVVADKELMAPGDRPIEICDGGKVVQEMLA